MLRRHWILQYLVQGLNQDWHIYLKITFKLYQYLGGTPLSGVTSIPFFYDWVLYHYGGFIDFYDGIMTYYGLIPPPSYWYTDHSYTPGVWYFFYKATQNMYEMMQGTRSDIRLYDYLPTRLQTSYGNSYINYQIIDHKCTRLIEAHTLPRLQHKVQISRRN